jgi:hypothetical protein
LKTVVVFETPPLWLNRLIIFANARGSIAGAGRGLARSGAPPDQNELQAQIQDYIREEVLYREALQLGLDKDDSIIRRRLRQKMEFLFEDTVPPPQEAELRAYLQSHIDKFRLAQLISFRQVFVSTRRGDAAEPDARQILSRLVAGTPGAADKADALLLGETFSQTPLDRIAALFGDDFAGGLAHAVPGQWEGPLRSAYGLHLVLVTAVEPAATPPFEQVRAAVEREWFAKRRSAAQAAQYEAVLAGYKVTVQDSPVSAR